MRVDEVITARRTFGRVDEHDGEYAETEFTCLGLLRIPLVPERSFWIVDDRGSQRAGFQIKLHTRSVAAAYLRVWAPAIATGLLVWTSSSLATAIAAALFALSAWSWTWWPRAAELRRRSDYDLAAFGCRCDPARMTDDLHQFLADQLRRRAGADAASRPPDDIVRFGARTVDEALLAYGALRLTDARDPRRDESRGRFRGAEWRIGRAARRLRRRGTPYRDRLATEELELWTMLSAAATASAQARAAGPLRSYGAAPAPGVAFPSVARRPWIWFALLAGSTVITGLALSRYSTSPPAEQQALTHPPPEQPRAAPSPTNPANPGRDGDLAHRRVGEYTTVQCDYVQNSPRGALRHVTLCLVGQRILAVAGGNPRHDSGRVLQGYIEAIPDAQRASWVSALRKQIRKDARYYDFYLRRLSYGDDTRDGDDEAESLDDDGPLWSAPSGVPANHTLIRALLVAASLATLAGWLVWIRLWQLRRRVARWIITG